METSHHHCGYSFRRSRDMVARKIASFVMTRITNEAIDQITQAVEVRDKANADLQRLLDHVAQGLLK